MTSKSKSNFELIVCSLELSLIIMQTRTHPDNSLCAAFETRWTMYVVVYIMYIGRNSSQTIKSNLYYNFFNILYLDFSSKKNVSKDIFVLFSKINDRRNIYRVFLYIYGYGTAV